MFLVCERCYTVHEFNPGDPYLKECHKCGREVLTHEDDVKKAAEYQQMLLDKIEEAKKEKDGTGTGPRTE